MKVEIKQTQLEFDGFAKVESAVLRFERFGGGMTQEMTRHRYFRGDAVAVLVYDPVTAASGLAATVSLRGSCPNR